MVWDYAPSLSCSGEVGQQLVPETSGLTVASEQPIFSFVLSLV